MTLSIMLIMSSQENTDFKKRGRSGPEKREDLGWIGESGKFVVKFNNTTFHEMRSAKQ